MKIGYFFKDYDKCIEDATYFKELDEIPDKYEIKYWAEKACWHAWYNSCGWEWLKDGTNITLVIDEKEIGDFEVSVECAPVFTLNKKS